jgi:hypothetical protein
MVVDTSLKIDLKAIRYIYLTNNSKYYNINNHNMPLTVEEIRERNRILKQKWRLENPERNKAINAKSRTKPDYYKRELERMGKMNAFNSECNKFRKISIAC